MGYREFVSKEWTTERLRLIGPQSEAKRVMQELSDAGFTLTRTGSYTNQSMFPMCDDTRFLFIAERATEIVSSDTVREPRKKLSRKQQVVEELRASDLTAQEVGRLDIEYGHHDSLPRGEHVARIKPQFGSAQGQIKMSEDFDAPLDLQQESK